MLIPPRAKNACRCVDTLHLRYHTLGWAVQIVLPLSQLQPILSWVET